MLPYYFFHSFSVDEIQEKLISRGEIREKLSHQFFSDIDGCDKETPYGKNIKLLIKKKI